MTFSETFTGREDRERVLNDILGQGLAVPGNTLIAHVDPATRAVLAVRCLPTPEPVLDACSCFTAESIQRLSAALRTLAQDFAPARSATNTGRRDVTGELITVVCRLGEAEVTDVDEQFFWGWRFSDHPAPALDCDVYVVTPSGWASLAGEWSGTQPALPANDPPGGETSAVQEAEQILADASLALLTPRSRECLLCYVHRMLLEFGCHGRLRFAAHFRDTCAPRATAMERRLGEVRGLCDCGIFRNGYDLRPEHCIPEVVRETDGVTYVEEYRWPTPLPACLGVRSGSTQGCRLWWRRLHW